MAINFTGMTFGGMTLSGDSGVPAAPSAVDYLVVAGGGGGGSNNGGGCGAGSSFATGADGGSGIVVLAYPNTFADATAFSAGLVVNGTTTTGSNVPAADTASRAGYKIYKFTAGTGTITF